MNNDAIHFLSIISKKCVATPNLVFGFQEPFFKICFSCVVINRAKISLKTLGYPSFSRLPEMRRTYAPFSGEGVTPRDVTSLPLFVQKRPLRSRLFSNAETLLLFQFSTLPSLTYSLYLIRTRVARSLGYYTAHDLI